MSTRAIFVATVLLAAPLAHAGDPPAHTAAMLEAAYQVSQEDSFVHGVGAPFVNNLPAKGQFQMPIPPDPPPGGLSMQEGSTSWTCPRDKVVEFGVGCSYQEVNGEAVNEPDDWNCIDEKQPPELTAINQHLAPLQSSLADLLAGYHVQPKGVACNYNHFRTNPAAPSAGNAKNAFDISLDYAYSLADGIRANGATAEDKRCGDKTWNIYYARVAHALHYLQDLQSEHHNEGNMLCNASDRIPTFLSPADTFSYARAGRCQAWLISKVNDSTGLTPTYRCDDEVATGSRLNVSLTENMGLAYGFCLNQLPFACMGLERTMRHHCSLDTPKTLVCAGPASDHRGAVDNHQYCEGERFSDGGGQDFVGLAAVASKPILEEAMNKWAGVCREPDDPCVPADCNLWCQHSKVGEKMAGYCLNDSPDPQCLLHTCRCQRTDECGTAGQPCCRGQACQEGLECGAATGTCVPKGEGACNPKVIISPEINRLSCGEKQTLTVKLEPPGAIVTGLSYVFTNTAGSGHLTTPDDFKAKDNFETKSAQVTYTVVAGAPLGVDTITVDAFVTPEATDGGAPATKRHIGQATALIKVSSGCNSTYGYVGGPGYNSSCVTQLSAPTLVHPGDKVTVTAQINCSGGAVVYMSHASAASLDGGPMLTTMGAGGIYDYCYFSVPQPWVDAGAAATLPDDTEAHTIQFTVDPELQCSICAREDQEGIVCSDNPNYRVNVSGAAVVMYGVGGTHGWSAVKFLEIQVPTK